MQLSRIFSLFFVLTLFVSTAVAGESIVVETSSTALVFNVDKSGKLIQSYIGERLLNKSDYEGINSGFDAFPTFGGKHTEESALRIVHGDGNTSSELVFEGVSSETADDVTTTTISLKDPAYPVKVRLFFKAYKKQDVIEQWMEVEHAEKKDITLYDFASSYLSLSAQKYFLTEFHGDWAQEMQMEEQQLVYGTKTIESRIGVRSNQFAHACFLLSENQKAHETEGAVLAGQLEWPGSWQLRFENDRLGNMHVISGMNPYASHYRLPKNTVFKTPALLFTYSLDGTGTVTRRFHRWAKQYGINDGKRTRLTLLNNWEATYFKFDEQIIKGIIGNAADMGFELFLLDDGWFGNKYPRNSDHQGLGDWETNHEKLPNGLGCLVKEATDKGIRFGIWLEPEMVNPKSELYEKHPDWVITQPNREIDTQRNQMILDLTNPKVQDYVFSVVDNTMQQNPGIAYIKWDCNRYMTNAASAYLKPELQSHLFIEYTRGLFNVLDRVRAKYPDTYMMLCSGGGGRIDYATLRYFDEFWISDNTDALDRIFIQWGTTYFFPAMALASHVSVVPNHITQRIIPLKFRFDVAMSAKLGMDLQPKDMSEEDKQFAKNAIQEYYGIRQIVQQGDLYRLLSPYESRRTAMMYVSENKDKAVVFSYLLKKTINGERTPLMLKGLDPQKHYRLREINRDTKHYSWFSPLEGKVFSGDYLMKYGLRFVMYNEYDSKVILLEQAD
ncbi:MAG: alpha-galactosidase [Paludibacteraceae bacterium]|nr:alpha-galactosidase [Paludibacteraceae bacterium]